MERALEGVWKEVQYQVNQFNRVPWLARESFQLVEEDRFTACYTPRQAHLLYMEWRRALKHYTASYTPEEQLELLGINDE